MMSRNEAVRINRRQFLIGSSVLATACVLPGCSPQNRYRTEVVVLGAGFSGLMATRLLRQAGIETLLLEGSDRVGGRVYTLEHLPGKPEGGASEIGKSYHEFLQLCREFGIQAKSSPGRYATQYALSIQGRLMNESDWADSESNRLPAHERNTTPHRLLSRYLPRKPPIEDLADWGSQEWIEQDISLAGYLRNQGASESALQLIASNLNGNDIETLSWADLLKGLLIRQNSQPPGTVFVEGGLSRVSRQLQAQVGDSLLLRRRIKKITADSNGVGVECDDGTQVKARLAVCTLPFSTLRKTILNADFSRAKKEAIDGLQYTPVSIFNANIKNRFWEQDGLPEHTWTDTALGRIFVSHSGGTSRIRAFSMGKSALALDKMLEKGERQVFELLHQVRPSTRGALEFETALSWGTNPMALGAFSHYPVGSIARYAKVLARTEAGVVFAGEHTRVAVPGVEAALVSGRQAALEVQRILAGKKAA